VRNNENEISEVKKLIGKLNLSFRTNRLPVIHQTEIAECGLACLAMVSSYHGGVVDLRTLRNKHSISLKGVTLATIINISEKMNLISRAIKVEIEDLHLVRTPAILHWEMNHFVVLKKVYKNKAVIHDPGQGLRHVTLEQLSKYFSGVALELTPSNKFEIKEDIKRISLRGFISNIVGFKRSLAQIFLLSLVLQALGIMAPYYTQLVIDNVLVGRDRDFLVVLGVGSLMLAVITTVISLMRTWVGIFFNNTYAIQLSSSLVKHMMSLPISWFDSRKIGDILSRFSSLKYVQSVISNGIIQGTLNVIMCLATIVVMLIYSPLLTMITIAGLLSYIVLRTIFYRPFRQATEESIVKSADETSAFVETVTAISPIKIFAKESTRHSAWLNKVIASMNAGLTISKLSMLFKVFQVTFSTAESVVMLWVGANMVMANEMTMGMLFAFMAWKAQFVGAVYGLINGFFAYKMLDLHLERVGDIALEEEEGNLDSDSFRDLSNIKGNIQVDNLSFRFGSEEKWLFENVNIDISAGSSTVMSAPSGFGKTTLMKIMMGLIKPEKGAVKIDGINIETIGLKNYRQLVGAVMQDDKLISGTIRENITFFSGEVDEEWLKTCVNLAAIDTDIEEMPMGYESLVGEMGSMLSGGQIQRILIARALYRKPKILFLDEATSNLDRELESRILKNIDNLSMTRVHISHRTEVIENAEQLLNLSEIIKTKKEI